MRCETALRAILIAVCALLTAACAPRLYQRETLKLDHPDLDQFEIRYADFEGCLLKRPVPVSYRVKRALYTLTLDVHFGSDPNPAGLDVWLSGPGRVSARFPDLAVAPLAAALDEGVRYRIASNALRGNGFTLEVMQDQALLGQEIIHVRREHCRALSVGAEP